MPSPFPGMDPYLEDPRTWLSFHNPFIVAIAEGRLDDVDAVAGQLRGAVAPT